MNQLVAIGAGFVAGQVVFHITGSMPLMLIASFCGSFAVVRGLNR